MKRYRIDIFDRAFNFVDMGQTSDPTLIIDYLVQSASSVIVPKKLTASKGNYIQVRDDTGQMFQGIVTDYAYDGKTTTITMSQMSKLLDVDVFADVTTLPDGIESWMRAQLRSVYAGTDASQALTGLTFSGIYSTAGAYPSTNDGIYNLYDLAVYFFKVYGVIIDISFSVSARTVTFSFRKVDTINVWKIETKLADVADWSVNASSVNEYPNKMVIRNEADPTEELTYYWHPNGFSGTVDTDGTQNRVLPVVSRCALIGVDEEDTFENASYVEAVSQMYQSQFDDQIEITFNTSSRLVEVGQLGQCYSVIDGSTVYNTVLTGYQRLNDKYTRMTFGYVRTRLTQILQQERRRNQ